MDHREPAVTAAVLYPVDTMRGGDPTLVRDEIRHSIEQAIYDHPRSAQTLIGPSEVGTPCDRKLGFKLGATPSVTAPRAAWRPTVGSAVHTWLAAAMEAANVVAGVRRFLTEWPVVVGAIDGIPIGGTCDLYDRITATVIDFKVVGPSSLRSYRASGMPVGYRVQTHLYGRGFVAAGQPVDTVALLILPSNGELSDLVWLAEPYNESLADSALARASRIRAAQRLAGVETVNANLSTTEDHCAYCEWYRPGTTELAVACPGSGGPKFSQPIAPITERKGVPQ